MRQRRHYIVLILAISIAGLMGCDSTVPEHEPSLVVEAWLGTGSSLPPIRVSTSQSVSAELNALPAPEGTELQVTISDVLMPYERGPNPLWFHPVAASPPVLSGGESFNVMLESSVGTVTASGLLPPEISLLEALITAPASPISVVLVDSLNVGLDSLNLAINATTGFIYPVQVAVTWDDDGHDGWIEARLQPDATFSSSLIDFFLLPSEVFPESGAKRTEDGLLRWEGVYAVPVPENTSPLPEHELRVIMTRGDNRFARYMTSRDAPDRRDPVSNVNGGLGFVGGVAIDSLRITVSN